MHVGIAEITGQVIEKPDPRTSGKNTYYTLTLADVGWKARFSVTQELYGKVIVGDKRFVFGAKLSVVRAQRSGSQFADDFLSGELVSVRDVPPPKEAAK